MIIKNGKTKQNGGIMNYISYMRIFVILLLFSAALYAQYPERQDVIWARTTTEIYNSGWSIERIGMVFCRNLRAELWTNW